VVHFGVPKDYIYVNLLCLSYIGNILSHQSILGQLKPIFNIVTVPFNIILPCLVPGEEVCLEESAFIIGRGSRYRVNFGLVFISYPRECEDCTLIVL
jgi:hypothetical protein